MQKLHGLLFFGICTLLLSGLFISCNPSKNLKQLLYLQDSLDTSHLRILQNYEPIMQPGDRLSITVSALNPTSAIPYNIGSSTPAGGGGVTGFTNSYIVEADKSIIFP